MATSGGGATTSSADSQRLNDELMRRLHEKNVALLAEVKALRAGNGSSHHTPPSAMASAAHVMRPASSGGGEPTVSASKGSSDAMGATTSTSSAAATSSSVELRLLRQRVQLLERQLGELSKHRLEAIVAGEATGKVNKEVKDFFSVMREQLVDSLALAEAERFTLNERLMHMEMEAAAAVGRADAAA